MQMRLPQQRWQGWYAWFPVLPADDGLFWLERVWRKKSLDGRWEYRSLRSERERETESAAREI